MRAVARILSIDAGTTGVKSLVVDESGAVLGSGYREFPQSFPRPGWVEHDPDDWWTATIESSKEALAATGTEPSSVTAVGITNQRETTVIWDRASFKPIIRPSCGRTAERRRCATPCARRVGPNVFESEPAW